ncbi:uncharacterized protein Z520_03280 [Fonsecaea multimorphosa CBS 102226]|uniref:Mitochondrial fission process protein 1 n=1 Tax=Fonsecaea multimorphosa CBS 102226 TaxID=1442371 RepID=A0A0D2IUA4_9EURO|nr:uncharacterized protein Z520_03280 [Fonsecaea multimorphosa CBS 102226]KIY00617.1 hypothetical protein Z520_03280 [Fonsecaea multimorphosa CBS 102226]OAL19007.1 hypothetical protein AYO22_10336 [Fonsecaea multimorphosa]
MAGKEGDRPNSAFPREHLNKDLQKLVDKQDDWMDNIYEGEGPDTTETSMRYAAYANRLRTIMLSAHRYVAYTSDIGESFRPVAHPILVRSAYAVSWAYVLGDCGHEGWKAYKRNQRLLHPQGGEESDGKPKEPMGKVDAMSAQQPVHIPAIEDYRAVMAQRAVFQSLASMGLPAFTIHSVVKYSGKALKSASNQTIRTWGPIGLGLAVVPALPYLFDKPVEEAVEWTFYQAFRAIGGENAVGQRHATGRKEALQAEAKIAKEKKNL